VAEFVTACLADRSELKPGSQVIYASWLRNHIAPFFDGVTVAEVNDANVRASLAQLRKRLAVSTCQNILVFLGAILDEACVAGYLARNPVRFIPRRLKGGRSRKPPRVLVQAEIEALLAQTDELERAVFCSCLFAGLRSGEVRGLLWRDVDFTAYKIRVRQQARVDGTLGPLKTAESARDVAMPDMLARELLAYRGRKRRARSPGSRLPTRREAAAPAAPLVPGQPGR
jgi:integrase